MRPQHQNRRTKNRCKDARPPLEVDILTSEKPHNVSYITNTSEINRVLLHIMQNKEIYLEIKTK